MLSIKIILFSLLLPLLSFSQQADVILSKFFAVQVDETVFMRWTITAGNTCEDTHIERSSDGISYERIGLIGGICGSPDEDITFEFTDSMPLVNQVSFYRLLLGYFGYTAPKTVEFVRYNDKGYFLGPNPFSNFTRLAFDNKEKEEHLLLIIDMQGRVVREMKTTGDAFVISRLDLESGAYNFKVLRTGQFIFSGSIVAN